MTGDGYRPQAPGVERQVKLTSDEECAILQAHDYGIQRLHEESIELLHSVLAKLKDEIWPQ